MGIPANRLSRAGFYRPSNTSNYPSALLGRDAARLRFSASIPGWSAKVETSSLSVWLTPACVVL